MIDALLYSVRDAIRANVPGYGPAECEIMDDGRPPPRAGGYFAAVHGGKASSGPANLRNLDELFGFSVTLTMRVTVPLDRVGDQQIARNLALVPQGQRQGFNVKAEQLATYLHMNWRITVLTGQTPNSANDNIAAWATGIVYGFDTPAYHRPADGPKLVGSEWFGAEPGEQDDQTGIVQELRFEGARRFQPQTAPVGPFV